MDVLVNLIQVAFPCGRGFWGKFWIRLAARLGQVAKWPALMDLENVDMEILNVALL